jgi:hypothetical protein
MGIKVITLCLKKEFLVLNFVVNYLKKGTLVSGDVAQTVERSLCMREVRGSIPRISIFFFSSNSPCHHTRLLPAEGFKL